MREHSRRLVLVLACALVAGLVQNTGIFSLLGVRPNISMAFLIGCAFFLRTLSLFNTAIATSLLSLEFMTDGAAAVLAMIVAAASAFLLHDRLPGKPLVNLVFLVLAATFFFYAIVDFGYLTREGGIVVGEALYNVLWGVAAFMIGRKAFKDEKAF